MPQLELLSGMSGDEALLKSDGAYKTISEVSDELGVPQHVLRFWETHFPQVKPSRMRGARRYYRPEDIDSLKKIKALLYGKGFTIKGAKKVIKDKDFSFDPVASAGASPAPLMPLPPPAAAPQKAAARPDLSSTISELRVLKSMLASLL